MQIADIVVESTLKVDSQRFDTQSNMFVLQTLKLDEQQFLGEATCTFSEVRTIYLFSFF